MDPALLEFGLALYDGVMLPTLQSSRVTYNANQSVLVPSAMLLAERSTDAAKPGWVASTQCGGCFGLPPWSVLGDAAIVAAGTGWARQCPWSFVASSVA